MAPSIRRCTTVLALAAGAAVLAGCNSDQLSRTLGFVHDAPDEFTVTTRAPLAMPPSFTLPPPSPGVGRPQEQSVRTQAELALVPAMTLSAPTEGSSPGQQALVQAAGPPVTPAIRAEVDQEAKLDRPSESLTSKLMFWRKPQPPGIVVDPEKEAQRLRENAALGQNQDTGDTPIVQPKQRGWLQGLF
ncbi:MAG TPA: DUF3035 domain-containing protein [Acetobacteraceae bacterium]|nr:DUF3035 domain-containing protein [Acetobacteraceae bacterium]